MAAPGVRANGGTPSGGGGSSLGGAGGPAGGRAVGRFGLYLGFGDSLDA